jgi:predicted Zn finger-like uncharacterized protein
MPLTVTCPTCAAPVSVKDEYAGRKVRCPQCKTVLAADGSASAASSTQVPILPPPAVPPPPPPPPPVAVAGPITAKPIVPALPVRPPTATPLETPAARRPVAVPAGPKRRDDARPARRSKVLVELDDEEDYAPRSRRKDRPAGAHRNPLLWVLIGVIVLAVTAGGIAAVYLALGGLKPSAPGLGGPEDGQGADAERSPDDTPTLTRPAVERIRLGLNHQQVRDILGGAEGRPATEGDLSDVLNRLDDGSYSAVMDEWKPLFETGGVMVWRNGRTRLVVGYDARPVEFATVKGVLAVVGSGPGKWSVKLYEPRPQDVPVAIPLDDLIRQFEADRDRTIEAYRHRRVRVSAEVKAVTPQLLLVGPQVNGEQYTVDPAFRQDVYRKLGNILVGDRLTVVGRPIGITKYPNGKRLTLTECKLAE